jgi:hypothetical protein
MYRQTGVIIGKVLKGARPSELPIERPTKFELDDRFRETGRHGTSDVFVDSPFGFD